MRKKILLGMAGYVHEQRTEGSRNFTWERAHHRSLTWMTGGGNARGEYAASGNFWRLVCGRDADGCSDWYVVLRVESGGTAVCAIRRFRLGDTRTPRGSHRLRHRDHGDRDSGIAPGSDGSECENGRTGNGGNRCFYRRACRRCHSVLDPSRYTQRKWTYRGTRPWSCFGNSSYAHQFAREQHCQCWAGGECHLDTRGVSRLGSSSRRGGGTADSYRYGEGN